MYFQMCETGYSFIRAILALPKNITLRYPLKILFIVVSLTLLRLAHLPFRSLLEFLGKELDIIVIPSPCSWNAWSKRYKTSAWGVPAHSPVPPERWNKYHRFLQIYCLFSLFMGPFTSTLTQDNAKKGLGMGTSSLTSVINTNAKNSSTFPLYYYFFVVMVFYFLSPNLVPEPDSLLCHLLLVRLKKCFSFLLFVKIQVHSQHCSSSLAHLVQKRLWRKAV